MPLSPPQPRNRLHRRTIQCAGYRRADGLWDVEGYLLDIKDIAFPGHGRDEIPAGAPFHEMWIRLTIDDEFLIHEVETVIDNGPTGMCGAVADDFNTLKGLVIGKGFNREVRERLGGVNGCAHLVDLLTPIATAAFQTLFATREARAAQNPDRSAPAVINQCHALASDGELVRQVWPKFYTGTKD